MNTNLVYNISLPSNLGEGKKYPVIYAMHGMGSNEKDIMSVIEELNDDFIIIGIRGPLTMSPGFAYFTIKSFGNPDIDSFDEVIEKIEGFIDNCPNQYPIDPSRQFLLGFSQGAILSMTLALTTILPQGGKPMSIVWKLDTPIPVYFTQLWKYLEN